MFETLKKNPPKLPKENFLNVHFGLNITLKWDVEQSRLIEDSEYDATQKDTKKISILIDNISNVEDLDVKMCSKRENLKKGDVAFLYLARIGIAPEFDCFKIQFDVWDEGCPYPRGVLDYLEENRIAAKNKVIACQRRLSH